MAEIIKMPLLSDTMTEGTIVTWHKKVGDEIESGDELFEVETDKAVMVQESYSDGTLLHIQVKPGEVAPIGGVVAVIGDKGEDYKEMLEEALNSESKPKSEDSAPAPKPNGSSEGSPNGSNNASSDSKPETQSSAPKEVATQPKTTTDSRVKASPLAKKMAEENKIQLSNVPGTGENGRIVKRDIEAYLEKGPTANTPMMAASGKDQDQPISGMRRVIASRLQESKFTAPHFYLTVSINMDNAMSARKQMNEIAPQKISFNDLVVKAAAVALRKHPTVNSSWMGDFIRVNGNINIGVAVAVEDGLLVPVINNADFKSLSQINSEVRELAGKAKERRLNPDQMQGNTFTISNLGMMGIEEFTAIINPPDSCILAVGTITQQAIVQNGGLTIGNIMKVTMSCDHRVVDGASGAQFLQTFKTLLENPVTLLV